MVKIVLASGLDVDVKIGDSETLLNRATLNKHPHVRSISPECWSGCGGVRHELFEQPS